MIRTRDFLLFLISVGFLLVIITAETARQYFARDNDGLPVATTPAFNENALSDISAEVVMHDGIDRQANIERLREKLRDFIANPPEPETSLSAPPPDNKPLDTSTTTEDNAPVIPTSALLCGGYLPYAGAWPNQLLSIDVQEGVRVVSAKSVEADGGNEVVVVLPIRTVGDPVSPSCLPTDVVAVAQSGSLIRNNEAGGYRAFPEHVLVGYTLDGYGLYGHTTKETDHCGGVMVNGEYRYYLSETRETALNCFVAPPVALP